MFSEPALEAWSQRFGATAPAEAGMVEGFLRHRSVRKFTDRPVSDGLVASLVASAQSAATSSHLQLWSIVSIQNPERRARIAELCGDQAHIRSAAWFFVFVADHFRLHQAAAKAGLEPDGLDLAEMYAVSAIDCGLAAERMVCAAESVGLGTCYIGAVRNNPSGVAETLELPLGTIGLFGLCLGWPDPESGASIKPRLDPEALWFRETYGASGVAEYETRMADFYSTQGQDPGVGWIARSSRRCQVGHMSGRETWADDLRVRGLSRR